ncbi:hypothetical protein B484DRAFT_405082 [Ochromonadaceae sp. CCMP2298]|nr:hypothetical protein B484DRAFT_405082 [Ochromonadaceae sp. CCMP2298]
MGSIKGALRLEHAERCLTARQFQDRQESTENATGSVDLLTDSWRLEFLLPLGQVSGFTMKFIVNPLTCRARFSEPSSIAIMSKNTANRWNINPLTFEANLNKPVQRYGTLDEQVTAVTVSVDSRKRDRGQAEEGSEDHDDFQRLAGSYQHVTASPSAFTGAGSALLQNYIFPTFGPNGAQSSMTAGIAALGISEAEQAQQFQLIQAYQQKYGQALCAPANHILPV